MDKAVKMFNICMITTAHSPFDPRIFQKEARYLVKAGHDVTLIAQHDRDEIVDGVKIISLVKSRNRIDRMTKTAMSAFRKALAINADIYHIHEPELIPVGLKLQRLGRRVIYDIHEDTTKQILLKEYIPLPLRSCLSRVYALFEDNACKKFSALVTPQNKMTAHYSSLNVTTTVENFVDISLYPHRVVDFNKPILLHAGSLTPERGLYNMVKAAKEIQGEFLFYVAGYLPEKLKSSSLSPLIYLGELNQEAIVNIYRKSNMGIILYNNIGQYSMAGAVKCYEYMVNSMPIVMPDFGEWVDFNNKHQCGINVDVMDAKNVAEAIGYLIKNPVKAKQMGENGRKWVERTYSWQNAFKKLQALYQYVLAQ